MEVALYSRVSTNDQNPLIQKEALIKKATDNKWDYQYFEEKQSTRNTRPIKNQIYLDSLKGKYDIVCVWKVDRWARSVQELARDIETLFNHNIKFISITDNIDLSSASGRLQFNVICAFAQFERDIISERTKEAFYKDKDGVTRLTIDKNIFNIYSHIRDELNVDTPSSKFISWNNTCSIPTIFRVKRLRWIL